jgi:hypothetical protein
MTTKSKERTKASGEVFTPRSLIREMLDRLPNAVWFDPNKTWLEPAAGDGNFLVEIKARLLQAGHDEIHIFENMLFSIELIDDNHWALQHRLGYLIDGAPNPRLHPDHFAISKISQLTQDLNDKNPYVSIGCARDEVIHHRNHVCASGLEYDMSFGRSDDSKIYLPLLPERDLSPWPETDTPDIGERYIVERMLGTQPQLVHESNKIEKTKKTRQPEVRENNYDAVKIQQLIRSLWDSKRAPAVNRALLKSKIVAIIQQELKSKKLDQDLQTKIKNELDNFSITST